MRRRAVDFLTLAELIEIHRNQIELYGGNPGIRDITLVSSAIVIPKSTFDGDFLHGGLLEMAAAYVYHIYQNHPFVDGNKRVALVAGLVFLKLNGISIEDPRGELYSLMMRVAAGKTGKDAIAATLKRISA
jgi:death-on-curing protein